MTMLEHRVEERVIPVGIGVKAADYIHSSYVDEAHLVFLHTLKLIKRIDSLLKQSCVEQVGRVSLLQGFVSDKNGGQREAEFTIDFNDIRGERQFVRNVRSMFVTMTTGPGVNIRKINSFREQLLGMG